MTGAAESVLEDAEEFHNRIGPQQKSDGSARCPLPAALTCCVPSVRTAQTVDMQIRN